MKLITELLKIALLLTIAILIGTGTGIFQKPLSVIEPEPSRVSDEESVILQNTRKDDLRKIMEHSLTSMFKFPESVKFQNTKYEYKRLLQDVGIEVDLSKELEVASLCGHYSMQNAMGVYGAFEPFYAMVAVSNGRHVISGELWFSNDGKIQKLHSLDEKYPLDGDKEKFEILYSKNCGEIDKAYMGTFSSYEFGYEDSGAEYYAEELNKILKHPDVAKTLQICIQAGASFGYCMAIEHCQISELESDYEEFCTLKKEICSNDDSPEVCEEKFRRAYKEKILKE